VLGLGLLVRLGRQVLAGPVADSGMLPAGYYRHLVLAALEEDDFPEALHHLKWVADPLLAQLLVLRLRLLARQHGRRRQAIANLMAAVVPGNGPGSLPAPREKYQKLLRAEDQALELLGEYEAQALAAVRRSETGADHPIGPASIPPN
jgi:hypothetical protein